MTVVDELLGEARSGSCEAVERLLGIYQDYLKLLATQRMGTRLAGRVSPSDLVQEAMLAAWKEFQQFRGESSLQFTAWLRTILMHRISAAVAVHLKSAKRDALRERRVASPGGSSILMPDHFKAKDRTPSSIISETENADHIQQLLCQLPVEYRQVILWRNFEGVQFNEIAERIGKTSGATRLLWLRAIRALRVIYEDADAGET